MQTAYEYDIVKNINSESPFNGVYGIVMQTTSKGVYVTYVKYNNRQKKTEEVDSKWEKYDNLELVASLGEVGDLLSKSTTPGTTTTSTEETPKRSATRRIETSPEELEKKSQAAAVRKEKKLGIIDNLSNNQILAYDENKLSQSDKDIVDKFVQEFQRHVTQKTYWGNSRQILYPSIVVFTGNGKYKRNVLAAAAKAAGGTVAPQIQLRGTGNYNYLVRSLYTPNFLVVSNKSGKEKDDSTKLKLAKQRNWNIISEDAFLKLLQQQDADMVNNVCVAIKNAIKGTS